MSERTVMSIDKLHHWFGENKVLYDVNVNLVRGQITALVGPSGCGKSTLLRAIVGTHPPCKGNVLVQQGSQLTPVTGPGRDRGIVYQRYSLFPYLTALENVAIGPLLDETTFPQRLNPFGAWKELARKHREEADAMLKKLGLSHARNNYPHEMSGGMCQRVAIGQALIMKPSILLLDEPFGALDEATREELQRTLLTLYSENIEAVKKGEPAPYTILMVTHELNEALFVSDRVLGLSQYWDWAGAGIDSAPGATIVYDQPAPIFQPGDDRDFMQFKQQKEEILNVTFDPEMLQAREEFSNYWHQVAEGRAGGVVQQGSGQ